jgi:transposase
VLAYFDTDGLSNGGTEAINMLIEKARRLAHGYRNFTNYRLRMLLAASGTRTRRGSNSQDLWIGVSRRQRVAS